MILFPLFEDIENKNFLVIGGGETAKEKVKRLKLFTNNIKIVAKETDIKTAEMREFKTEDLNGADYVISACADDRLNQMLFFECKARRIPLNVVDRPELCTFVFPAIIKKGDLIIAISTSGKSPAYARYIKSEIEKIIPKNSQQVLNELFALRQKLKKTVSSQKERAKLLKIRLNELTNNMQGDL